VPSDHWLDDPETQAHILCVCQERIDQGIGGEPFEVGTGSVCCRSICVLHLSHFLNQEDLMEREAMVQNP